MNWVTLAANGAWVFGLAIILAAVSYHYWVADQERARLGETFARPTFQRSVYLGLLLIGLGLAGTSRDQLQFILAAVIVLGSAVALVLQRR